MVSQVHVTKGMTLIKSDKENVMFEYANTCLYVWRRWEGEDAHDMPCFQYTVISRPAVFARACSTNTVIINLRRMIFLSAVAQLKG